jgi:hypothetical protein
VAARLPPVERREILQGASFGERIAEQELDELAEYFVETDQWRRLYAGDVDIVYGPKGSGKSALYSLLVTKQQELFDRGILIVPAENPSGAPAFQDLAEDPPTSEAEFVGLWKIYFLGLIAVVLKEWGVETDEAKRVYEALRGAGLLQEKATLQSRLQSARGYVKRLVQAEAVEGGLILDPGTGMPVGVTGKITLRPPEAELRAAGVVSVDELLAAADEALAALEFNVWLILDRLDVAFVAREELEQNALRARRRPCDLGDGALRGAAARGADGASLGGHRPEGRRDPRRAGLGRQGRGHRAKDSQGPPPSAHPHGAAKPSERSSAPGHRERACVRH